MTIQQIAADIAAKNITSGFVLDLAISDAITKNGLSYVGDFKAIEDAIAAIKK